MVKNRRIIRRYLATVVLIVLSLPFVGIGAIRSIDSMCVAPEKWAPSSYEARQTYDWFSERFESGDVVIVSWEGCSVDDPRLANLEAILGGGDAAYTEIIDRIATGFSALRGLQAPPLALTREQAVDRLKGSLVGSDGKTSCAVITLTKHGNDQRRESIETILRVVETECHVPTADIHVVGPPVNGDAIDRASVYGIKVFSNLSIVVSVLLCWFCVRSWLYTLTIVGTGVFGQGLTLAMVYYSGYELDAILIVIPSLVLVLTVSGGVHLTNYYRDEVRLRGHDGAAERALANGVVPCLLAALTTAIGAGSLVVSELTPVMLFGIVSSVGVMATVCFLLLLLPGAMELWPSSPAKVASPRESADTRRSGLNRFANFVLAKPNLNTVVFVGLMLGCAAGLPKLTTSVDVLSLFSSRHRLVHDYRWFETNVGPSVPVEVVVKFDRDSSAPTLQRLQLVSRIQACIEQSDDFGGSTSAATFAPNFDAQPAAGAELLGAEFVNQLVDSLRPDFVKAHFLSEAESEQSWRISTRTTALGNPDYAESLTRLQDAVAEVVAGESPSSRVSVVYTGMMTLASIVQQEILRDLYSSFLSAVAVVTVVMVIAVGGLAAGLLSMLPNVFPIILVFGVVGLCRIPVDIGMLMTASVAMGIAIDDTLHLVTWYRRLVSGGTPPADAVRRSILECGMAMIHSSVIPAFGLLVFALSDFVPTQRFAWMMFLLLAMGLAADLILTPSLIAGVFHRSFSHCAIPASQRDRASVPADGDNYPIFTPQHAEQLALALQLVEEHRRRNSESGTLTK